MRELRSPLTVGALVEARRQTWRVVEVVAYTRCTLVRLRRSDSSGGHGNSDIFLLAPFDDIAPAHARRRLVPAGRRRIAARLAGALAAAHPWPRLWSAAGTDIAIMPWQLEPALAVLGGATRVLLADGVGGGKTIESGLIIAELTARGLARRTLVLTPAGLRRQWADELHARFGLHPVVLDKAALTGETRTLPAGASPWRANPLVVSSIDMVKRPENAAAIDSAPIDLLVVDEAHHLTPGSERAAVVARLAARTPWVVMASATPYSGDPARDQRLDAIGGTNADQVAVFRGHDRGGRNVTRRTHLVRVHVRGSEAVLLQAIARYAEAVWADRGRRNPSARLVAAVLLRRAASSMAALHNTLTRRLALMAGTTPVENGQPPLPWDEPDDDDADAEPGVLDTPGLEDQDSERRLLVRLVALACRARRQPAKLAWLVRFLAHVREPVIVFSEYRDTVALLRERLPVATVTLHGGLSPDERRNAVAAFTRGGARVLLATDAGGEGLNLQARCRLVVNVELPWNPLRLEQRAGRVDRIGQQRRVHVFDLVHSGTAEDTVLAHLYLRLVRMARAQFTAAGLPNIETRVADAVFGGATAPLAVPVWSTPPGRTAHDEARRLVRVRGLSRFTGIDGGPSTPLLIPRRRDGPSSSVVLVFTSGAAAGGRELTRVVTAVEVALRDPVPADRAPALDVVTRLAADARIMRIVSTAAAGDIREAVRGRLSMAGAVMRRIAALDLAVAQTGAPLYQPALFIDRQMPGAAGSRHVAAATRAHLQRVRDRLPAGDLTIGPPSLVCAWLVAEPRK